MSREVMQQALEALERYSGVDQRACDAEEALRQALKIKANDMELRDCFAIEALRDNFAFFANDPDPPEPSCFAKMSYEFADAMIREKNLSLIRNRPKEEIQPEEWAKEEKLDNEPVAWISESENLLSWDKFYDDMKPLYTAPPKTKQEQVECMCGICKLGKREWVGLTDGEIHDMNGYEEDRRMYRFARAIEAKLKEKNT